MATADDVSFVVQRRRRHWWQFWRRRWTVEQWVPLTADRVSGVTGTLGAFHDRTPLRRFWRLRRASKFAEMQALYRVPRS